MAEIAISQDYNATGEWSIPCGADVAGNMKWSGRRVTLELSNSLVTPVTPGKSITKLFRVLREVEHYPFIHGSTTTGHLVTVLDAYLSKWSTNFGPAGAKAPVEVMGHSAVIGAHVSEATKYSEMRFRVPGLHLWLALGGIDRTFVQDGGKTAEILYGVKTVPELTISLPAADCTLAFSIGRHLGNDGLDTITIRTSGSFRLSPREPRDLAWFLQEAAKVTSLIALMSATPMAPDIVNADVSDGPKDVAILVALRDGELCTHKSAHDFFMTCPDAQTSIAAAMQAWFSCYDAIKLPARLALSAFLTRNVNHVVFLTLTQALEGLHRATFGGKYVADDAYEPTRIALSNAIPQGLSADHKLALKARLKYGNEYSLQKRLGELQKQLDPLVAARVLKGGSVPPSWVKTRNYFTHWDEASKADILEGLDLYAAMVRMRAMLRALFLGHATIPASALLAAMEGTSNEAQELLQLHD